MARNITDKKGMASNRKQEELDAKVDTTGFMQSLYEECFRLEELQKATRKRLEVLGVIIRRLVPPVNGRGG